MAAPVQRDQELELTIDSLAYGGNGVARLNGFVVFVRRGLPGDTVRARVTKVQRRHAEALATEVVTSGPQRVDAPCAHYPACGGCRFQDLAYESQLAAQQQWGADSLQRLAGLAGLPPRRGGGAAPGLPPTSRSPPESSRGSPPRGGVAGGPRPPRSSRSPPPRRSSTTATRWSTRSRSSRMARRSACTKRGGGTRCSR